MRRPSAHAAVIGGQPAAPGTFPWMAYVLDLCGSSIGQCSGTVVAPNLVLTAGHCAENMQTGVVNEASGYRVLTGNVDAGAPATEKQTSGVTRVIVCSCRDRHTAVGDVALANLIAAPTLPGVAGIRSVRLGSNGISLVLTCDGEGGVCSGDAEASVKVRARRLLRSGGRLIVLTTRTFRATLAKVVFAIAPGASTAVSSELSPQNRTLLSRLGGGQLDVLLSGQGVIRHVARLVFRP